MPLLKGKKEEKKKKPQEHSQPRHGKGGGGTVWTMTPPMNECMEASVRKMFIPTQLDQEFETV